MDTAETETGEQEQQLLLDHDNIQKYSEEPEKGQAFRNREWTVLCFWSGDIRNYVDECVKAVNDNVFHQRVQFGHIEDFKEDMSVHTEGK